ncbi:MAG: ATP-binding protein [Bacteroidota bacterium]
MLEKTIDQLRSTTEDHKKSYAEFIDIAAHDLDAPLRRLSILIERLTSKYKNITENDAQTQEWLTRIDKCLIHMRSLIDGLSELSGANYSTQEDHTCNIKNQVNEILQELEPEIKEKNAVISQLHLPAIQGSEIQLRQLFKNLIENSLRFCKKNISPEISISSLRLNEEEKKLHGLDPGKEYFKISISDNGIGFKQEYAEKIFQPFIRLNARSAFEGNGLGLAICKRIVDNHKGILYAEGIENSGTRFTLILPETRN